MKVGGLGAGRLIKHYLLVQCSYVSATISTIICTVDKNAWMLYAFKCMVGFWKMDSSKQLRI